MNLLRDLRVWAVIATLALGGSLLAAMVRDTSTTPPSIVLKEPAKPDSEAKPEQKPEQPKPKPEKTEEAKTKPPKTTKTPAKAKAWTADCDAPRNREEAVFCQQERLADSSERLEEIGQQRLQLAREQFWLSVFGFAGLLIVLYMIREAIKGR
jgi:outer membrane biosynthesis protein TonB